MTLRALARASVLVAVANLLPRAGAFLLLPIYARFLTQADFGVVSLAGSAALLLAIIYRLGLDAALLRMHFDVGGGAERRALYATVASLSLVVVIGGSVAGVLIAGIVTASDRDLLIVWLLALGIAAANTFQYVPSVWLRATEQPGRYLVLAIAAFASVVILTVALVVVLRLGALGSLLGQLAGALVMAVMAAGILMRMRPWRFRPALGRTALRFGLPLLPHTMAGWLLNLSDRWLLAILLALPATQALAAVGVYSLGYQLAYAISLAAISFNAAWLPFLYRVGQGPDGAAIVREATVLFIAGFAWLAAALAVLAPDLIRLIAPPDWAAAADVATLVSFGSALNAAGLMLASPLYLHRDTRIVPLLTLAAVLVNLVINVALIPVLGIMAAAWATVAAYATLALLTGVAAYRRHRISLDLVRLGLVAVVMVAPTAVALAVSPDEPVAAILWHVGLAVTAGVFLALLVGTPLRRVRALVGAAPGRGATPAVG